MLTTCEICNCTFEAHIFQKHLFDEHNILFSQYIGLISDKINFKNSLKTKAITKKSKKKSG